MSITTSRLKTIIMQEAKKLLGEGRRDDYADFDYEADHRWTDDGYRGPRWTATDDGPRDLEPKVQVGHKKKHGGSGERPGSDIMGMYSAAGDEGDDYDYENDRWRGKSQEELDAELDAEDEEHAAELDTEDMFAGMPDRTRRR